MKKKTLFLVIAAAVLLAVCLTVTFIIKNNMSDDTKKNGDGTLTMLSVQEDINKVIVENESGRFVFELNGDEWEMTEPTGFALNAVRCQNVPRRYISVDAMSLIEKNAGDKSQYGLEDCKNKVTMITASGKEVIYYVGNERIVGDAWYACTNLSDDVYMISAETYQKFSEVSKLFMMDSYVFTSIRSDIGEIKLVKGGEIVFHMKRQSVNSDYWDLLAPFSATMDTTQMSDILNSTAQLSVLEIVEDSAENLKQYGLEEPSYVLSVGIYDRGLVTLNLGLEMSRNAKTYACVAGTNDVFFINPSSLSYLDTSLVEMINPYAYQSNIDEVSAIEYSITDGEAGRLGIETAGEGGNASDDKFYWNDEEITGVNASDMNLGRALYLATISLKGSSTEFEDMEYGEAAASVTVFRADCLTEKLEFVERAEDDLLGLFKNGSYAHILFDRTELIGRLTNAVFAVTRGMEE